MPQTIVREFDETGNTYTQYSNFTVVVPGFIGERDTELADDYKNIIKAGKTDGIYEISSIKAFRGVIGYADCKGKTTSVAVTGYAAKPTEQKWYTSDGTLFDTATELGYLTPTAFAKLEQEADNSTGEAKFKLYVATIQADSGAVNGYLKKTGLTPAGSTNTGNYVFEEVHTWLEDEDNTLVFTDSTEDAKTVFACIKTGTYEHTDTTTHVTVDRSYEGCDSASADDVEIPAHYGNQIAYELVKAGYTVLFLALNPTDDDATGAYFEDKIKPYASIIAGTNADADRLECLAKLNESSTWEPLKDRAAYDFRYVISGLYTLKGFTYVKDGTSTNVTMASIYAQLGRLVTFINDKTNSDHQGRGDCIALFDLPEEIYSKGVETGDNYGFKQAQAIDMAKKYINNSINGQSANNDIFGKYNAFFTPEITYDLGIEDCAIIINDNTHHYIAGDTTVASETDVKAASDCQRSFPASLHYLLCAAYARENNIAEWWANAGESRGICKYKILSASVNFGEVGINELQPRYTATGGITRAVNPIALVHGTYYLYGSRTAYTVQDSDTDLVASHFLSIRELCTTLKKMTYRASFKFRFDPNSDLLWVRYCNYIRPTLERMKGNEGVLDYKFKKLATSKKAKLRGQIRIVPIEPVEDFDLGLYLEDSIDGEVASLFED